MYEYCTEHTSVRSISTRSLPEVHLLGCFTLAWFACVLCTLTVQPILSQYCIGVS